MIKRLLITLALLTSAALAQQGNSVTITSTGAPAGSCAYMMYYINSSNGDFYDCFNGAWLKVSGGGGGSGTVTVVGAGNLTSTALVTGGGAQAIQTPSATATLDSSGNLIIPGTAAVTGHTTFEGVTSTGATGTGKLVYDSTPTLTTAVLGSSTATTQAASDNSTKLATTAYADRSLVPGQTGASQVWTTQMTSNYTSADGNVDDLSGLSFTMPASTAATYAIDCTGNYAQATAATTQQVFYQSVTTAATRIDAQNFASTAAGAVRGGGIDITSPTTSSQQIGVNFTAGAINVINSWGVHLTVKQPSGSASIFKLQWQATTGGTDVTTVYAGSRCSVVMSSN